MRETDPMESVTLHELVQPANQIRFDRAAMLIGRSLYWGGSPQENANGVKALLHWCLSLPQTQLGISPDGVVKIVLSVLLSEPRPITPEIEAFFERFSPNVMTNPSYGGDVGIWNRHLDRLLDWLLRLAQPTDYIWLESSDVEWWIGATMRSLKLYDDDSNIEGDDYFRLLSRHDCTVFGRLNGAAFWDHIAALALTLGSPRQEALNAMLAQPESSREALARIDSTYWSWRQLDFARVNRSIICTPMLALWSEYPSSLQWARWR